MKRHAVVAVACLIAWPKAGAAQDAPTWNFEGAAFVAVSVSDLETSVEWYARALGLEVVRELDLPEPPVRVRLLRRDDVIVELIEHADPIGHDPAFADEPPFRFLGLLKSGVFVSDIEAFHGSLTSREADVDPRIGDDDATGFRTFIFRDPDGNVLQAFGPCGDECGSGNGP